MVCKGPREVIRGEQMVRPADHGNHGSRHHLRLLVQELRARQALETRGAAGAAAAVVGIAGIRLGFLGTYRVYIKYCVFP